jgi:hypothetical protein
MLIRNLRRLAVIGVLLALASNPALSREGGTSILGIHLATSPELSLREQHINQSILNSLLLAARRLPDVAPCQLDHPYQIDYVFGDFAVVVGHLNPAMHVKCLRGVVRYLLREDIAEVDFLAARAFEARLEPEWIRRDPKNPKHQESAAERLAFLAIYQKYSPLHQLHSVDTDAIAGRSFDDFTLWLESSRKAARFTFFGPRALLAALELPVPDPMVLQPVTSLASPRSPERVLFFDGERVEVPALIMLFLARDGTRFLDNKIKQRFACNQEDAFDLGDGFSAIARASCSSSDYFGDIWLRLALRKGESASYPDFCRQVHELSRDTDIATIARFSPDGSKGLYVLLPPTCKASE